jgi:plasmid stabilization system protein ParE
VAVVEFSARALADIDRLAEFLLEEHPREAARTAALIVDAIDVLREHPLIGRPAEHDLRELVISRGHTGYLALYAWDEAADQVLVLAIRHQREAGYA